MKQYLVDAFTDKLFSGNPAAVCVLDEWPSEQLMKNIALENNLSETAFVVSEAEGYHLRWFTPTAEIDLCGHATLATAFVILNYYDKDKDEVDFNTLSGRLKVVSRGDLYEMDFPTYEIRGIPVTDEMEQAFGVRPEKALLSKDLICVFDDEDTVRQIKPDLSLIERLPGRIHNATARGTGSDCVTRSFAPGCGIPEDPVCGSAHCQVADYWSQVLGKRDIVAYQASKRGGTLYCSLTGNGRIRISGRAVLFAVADLNV
ncbi:MAG: PhzF family phenazine biosynthesis protein [Anaerovoracaceae bacterium]|jgi:PhzF family phenazine biosynthesis protein